MSILQQYIRNARAATWQLFVAWDKWANACLLLGDPNETISSRADKAMREGKAWGCILCRLLARIQKDHCQISLQPDAGQDAIIPD